MTGYAIKRKEPCLQVRRPALRQFLAAVGAAPCENSFHFGGPRQAIRLKAELIGKTFGFALDLFARDRVTICTVAGEQVRDFLLRGDPLYGQPE